MRLLDAEVTIQAVTRDCPADCDRDSRISFIDLSAAIERALGEVPFPLGCPAADVNRDGDTTIEDLTTAVTGAASMCQGN